MRSPKVGLPNFGTIPISSTLGVDMLHVLHRVSYLTRINLGELVPCYRLQIRQIHTKRNHMFSFPNFWTFQTPFYDVWVHKNHPNGPETISKVNFKTSNCWKHFLDWQIIIFCSKRSEIQTSERNCRKVQSRDIKFQDSVSSPALRGVWWGGGRLKLALSKVCLAQFGGSGQGFIPSWSLLSFRSRIWIQSNKNLLWGHDI